MSKILIDEVVVRQAIEWIGDPHTRTVSAGKMVSILIEALAEQPAPAQEPDDERIAALRTLDYCHGLKAGWNFCVANDEAGFERAMASTSEAVRILKTQPAPAQEPDPDELTIAYMSGMHEGKKIGAKEGRNKLATWMMQCGFATGHGDTLEELLYELDTEVEDRLAAIREKGGEA